MEEWRYSYTICNLSSSNYKLSNERIIKEYFNRKHVEEISRGLF
jgi:hypothetical protein